MHTPVKTFLQSAAAAVALLLAVALPVHAQANDCAQALNALVENESPHTVKRFVTCAAAHVDAVGWEQAQADFQSEARWRDDSVYLFAHDLDGMNLFNASRVVAPGDNRYDVTDPNGFKYVQRLIYIVEKFGQGFVYYGFNNPATERVEHKVTYAHGVEVAEEGSIYLAAGFYPDAIPGACHESDVRAGLVHTLGDLQEFVACAALHLERRGLIALHELATAPRWKSGPTYLFLLERDSQITVFNGGTPALAGVYRGDAADSRGYRFVRDMARVAALYGEGVIYYERENPVSGQVEDKVSYIRNVRVAGFDYILGAGLYVPQRAACRQMAPARDVDTMAELQTHVTCAADLVEERGADAFDLFLHHPAWRDESIYVVVMDEACQDLVYPLEYRSEPDGCETQDENGFFFEKEIMKILAGAEGEGTVSFVWLNPASDVVENLTAYVRRADMDGQPVVVASGLYTAE